MKKSLSFITGAMLLLVLCLHVKAQSTSITWVNGPSPHPGQQYCVPVTQENGQAVASGNYYCPEQPTSFDNTDCQWYAMPQTCIGSLYLPDMTLEGITITLGTPQALSYNSNGSIHTWQRTDTLSVSGWAGTTTQQYTNVPQRYCNFYGCRTVLIAQATSGKGTLEQTQ